MIVLSLSPAIAGACSGAVSAAKNLQIGKVACPVKGCEQECAVFRYRERGAGAVSVANRRFAGKLYAQCPDHGRVGGDAHDAGMQDYILEHANMNSPAIAGAAPALPTPAPAKKPPASASEIIVKPRTGFGLFRR